MSITVTQKFSNLEKELETAKTDLRGLNENIKRIYGKHDNFGYKKSDDCNHFSANGKFRISARRSEFQALGSSMANRSDKS